MGERRGKRERGEREEEMERRERRGERGWDTVILSLVSCNICTKQHKIKIIFYFK